MWVIRPQPLPSQSKINYEPKVKFIQKEKGKEKTRKAIIGQIK